MNDRVSIARRSLDFEDYLDILRRSYRWILGAAFAGLVISTVVAFLLPDTYVSVALIRIVPQQISDSLVQNATSQQIADHINAMAESILSRNTLTSLINIYHLYPGDVKSEPMEDVINEMKSAISIHATSGVADLANSQRSLPAMQVSFKYRDRLTAQKITDEMVSRLMSQNSQESMAHTESATQFMNDETDRARRQLDEINQKLSDYRTRNAGHLPEEMEMNLQQMNALSQQETALSDAVNRNAERRMLLESNLQIAKERLASVRDATPQTAARNEHLDELNREINKLETDIETMKDHYTDDFPDLKNARQQLAVLQRQRDAAQKEKPKDAAAADNSAPNKERMDAQATVDMIKAQLQANTLEEQQVRRELQKTQGQAQSYASRVQGVPAGEKEYAELIHDRDLAKQHYDELEQKQQRASLSADLERRKEGETLEVLDSASLPNAPAAPKRPLIVAIGPAVGFLIGLILVSVREMKDQSLKNLKDARLYTRLTVLGSIPLIENELLIQRRRQLSWIGWTTATLGGLAIMGATIAHYFLTKA